MGSIVMTRDELEAFLDADFPQMRCDQNRFEVSSVTDEAVDVRFIPGEHHLRPGGTVSGPSLFALADVAAYLAILSRAGPSVHDTVTTNLSINFLRRPRRGPLTARASLLKLGARLAVVEVAIRAEEAQPVAHAVATYAIPPATIQIGGRLPGIIVPKC